MVVSGQLTQILLRLSPNIDDALTELVNQYANRTLIVSCTKDYS